MEFIYIWDMNGISRDLMGFNGIYPAIFNGISPLNMARTTPGARGPQRQRPPGAAADARHAESAGAERGVWGAQRRKSLGILPMLMNIDGIFIPMMTFGNRWIYICFIK